MSALPDQNRTQFKNSKVARPGHLIQQAEHCRVFRIQRQSALGMLGGFIKLVGLPVRTQAEVQGSAATEPLLQDDRHVVEVGPGTLEGGLAEPVLAAAVPGIVDPNLGG